MCRFSPENSIENNEYLLLAEKLLQQVADSSEAVEMEWAGHLKNIRHDL